MWISRYFVLFCIFSVMGWIYESIYCTVRDKKWNNRGFLFGPVVPIYGAGGVALVAVVSRLEKAGLPHDWWCIFIIAYLGSVVLEFGTSWILEKLFHAKWWDYSKMPLNIQGRVCVPFSVCFGLAGLLVYYIIYPFTMDCIEWIPAIGYEAFALIFMGLLSMDATLTVTALTSFDQNVREMNNAFNARMEELVEEAVDKKAKGIPALIPDGRLNHIDRHLSAMGGLGRSALSRVTSFSRQEVEDKKVFEALSRIRDMRSRKKSA